MARSVYRDRDSGDSPTSPDYDENSPPPPDEPSIRTISSPTPVNSPQRPRPAEYRRLSSDSPHLAIMASLAMDSSSPAPSASVVEAELQHEKRGSNGGGHSFFSPRPLLGPPAVWSSSPLPSNEGGTSAPGGAEKRVEQSAFSSDSPSPSSIVPSFSSKRSLFSLRPFRRSKTLAKEKQKNAAPSTRSSPRDFTFNPSSRLALVSEEETAGAASSSTSAAFNSTTTTSKKRTPASPDGKGKKTKKHRTTVDGSLAKGSVFGGSGGGGGFGGRMGDYYRQAKAKLLLRSTRLPPPPRQEGDDEWIDEAGETSDASSTSAARGADSSPGTVLSDVQVRGHHADHLHLEGNHPIFVPLPSPVDGPSSPLALPPSLRPSPLRVSPTRAGVEKSTKSATKRGKRPRASDESGRTAAGRSRGRTSLGGGGGGGGYGTVTILSPGRRDARSASLKGKTSAHRSPHSSSSSPYISSSGSKKRLKASFVPTLSHYSSPLTTSNSPSLSRRAALGSVLNRPRPGPRRAELRLQQEARRVVGVGGGGGSDGASVRSRGGSLMVGSVRSGKGEESGMDGEEEKVDEFGLKDEKEHVEQQANASLLDTPSLSARYDRFTRSAAPSPATYLSPTHRRIYRDEVGSPSSVVDSPGSLASFALSSPGGDGRYGSFGAPHTPLPYSANLSHLNLNLDGEARADGAVASSTPIAADSTPTAAAVASRSRARTSKRMGSVQKEKKGRKSLFTEKEQEVLDTLNELSRSISSVSSVSVASMKVSSIGAHIGELDSPSKYEDAPDDRSEVSDGWEDYGDDPLSPSTSAAAAFPFPPSSFPAPDPSFITPSFFNTTTTSSAAAAYESDSSAAEQEDDSDALSAAVVTTARRLSLTREPGVLAHKASLSSLKLSRSRPGSANNSPTASIFRNSPPLSPLSQSQPVSANLTSAQVVSSASNIALGRPPIRRNPSGREWRDLPLPPVQPLFSSVSSSTSFTTAPSSSARGGHARSVSTSALPVMAVSARRPLPAPPTTGQAPLPSGHSHPHSLSASVYPSGTPKVMRLTRTSSLRTTTRTTLHHRSAVNEQGTSYSSLSAAVPASTGYPSHTHDPPFSSTSFASSSAPNRPTMPTYSSLPLVPLSSSTSSSATTSHAHALAASIHRTPAFVAPNTPSVQDRLGEMGREVFGVKKQGKGQGLGQRQGQGGGKGVGRKGTSAVREGEKGKENVGV